VHIGYRLTMPQGIHVIALHTPFTLERDIDANAMEARAEEVCAKG